MALTFQECLEKIKEMHPDLYPVWWIEEQGVYLFNMLSRGVAKDEANCNLYAISPETGESGPPLPVMMVHSNLAIAEKLQHPHMITGEDQAMAHGTTPGFFHAVRPVEDQDTLMHYGIKGMRWGVRRFQNEDGSLTAAGKARYSVAGTEPAKLTDKGDDTPKQKLTLREKMNNSTANVSENWQKGSEIDMEPIVNRDKSKKGDHSKAAMDVVLSVLNPINAVFLGVDAVKSAVAKHKTDSYMKGREEKSTLDPETGLYMKKEGAYDDKADLAAVNPGFMNMNSNSKNNCVLCTTTYDMRKRGYDVSAQLDSEGYNWADIKKWYPDAKVEHTSRRNEQGMGISQKEYLQRTIDNLQKQPDGARGNFFMLFTGGGGHSIAYEIQNGKVIFKDGQTNTVYTKPEKILSMTIANSYARLDNCAPNLDLIKKQCVR